MKRSAVYKVDLTKIEGEGDFPCPNCGVIISPEDETETVYTILNTKMKKESLVALIIQCNRCGSKIHLVGFLSPPADKAKSEQLQPERIQRDF